MRFELIEQIVTTCGVMLYGVTQQRNEELYRSVINHTFPGFPGSRFYGMKPLDTAEIQKIISELMRIHGIHQNVGNLISLTDANHDECWYEKSNVNEKMFRRYSDYLRLKKYSDGVLNSLNETTTKIVTNMGDPKKQGSWLRKGMVVGDVQSGKTSNFIGVINKACDAGYKLIIIAAGMTESLRVQTQERIDEGVSGRCSTSLPEHNLNRGSRIGIGCINNSDFPNTSPAPVEVLTSIDTDFSTSQTLTVANIRNSNVPWVFVVKKNATILMNLATWLTNIKNKNDLTIETAQNYKINDIPMLLIDDECDQASINTKNPDDDPTTINNHLRIILAIFQQRTYLAYTATPFANIFIDPDDDNIVAQDLFPKNFIISIVPPNNYFGPKKIFSENSNYNVIEHLEDVENHLPMKHKNGCMVASLPQSLHEAIYAFIVAKAIRIVRGQGKRHHSMLIHISRFNNVQEAISTLVRCFVKTVHQAVLGNAGKEMASALDNTHIKYLHEVWKKFYIASHSDWGDIQEKLKDAVETITVEEVNGNPNRINANELNYRTHKDGYTVIAVGGNKLSRGLTLEDLVISYFYRNTSMYDTLMQMGRWFGYRDNYEDLCKVYMTEQTDGYFQHISESIEELRYEFIKMEKLGKSPAEFGLAVRAHPNSLLITARNKMRKHEKVERRSSLSGRLIETVAVHSDKQKNESNLECFQNLILSNQCEFNWYRDKQWYGAEKVNFKEITTFIGKYTNHSYSAHTSSSPLIEFIEAISFEHKLWDIVIISKTDSANPHQLSEGVSIGIQDRTSHLNNNLGFIEFGQKKRVGSKSNELFGMEQPQIDQAKEEFKKSLREVESNNDMLEKLVNGSDDVIPGTYLRMFRPRPLLILHFIFPRKDKFDKVGLGFVCMPAFGISFPKLKIDVPPVTYAANTIYARQMLMVDSINNQEEEYDDDD
jgi:Z1 domain